VKHFRHYYFIIISFFLSAFIIIIYLQYNYFLSLTLPHLIITYPFIISIYNFDSSQTIFSILGVCLLPIGRREFFCVCFHDFESGREDGERMNGFFHSSQNEKICGNLVGLLHFTKIPLYMYFILIYKIKYYINLFIIYNFKNI